MTRHAHLCWGVLPLEQSMYSSQMMTAVQSRASFGLCAGQLCGLAKGRPARLPLLLPAPLPRLRSLQPLHRFWQFCQAASAILCL